jgi:hypothetical protein
MRPNVNYYYQKIFPYEPLLCNQNNDNIAVADGIIDK